MTFTFAETKPGSGLCKPGTIALFGNVVYSDLLNEHLWHFGLPVITRLVSFFFSSCLIFLLLPVYCELLLLIWICTWSPRVEMYSLHSSCKTSNIITHTDTHTHSSLLDFTQLLTFDEPVWCSMAFRSFSLDWACLLICCLKSAPPATQLKVFWRCVGNYWGPFMSSRRLLQLCPGEVAAHRRVGNDLTDG